MKKMIFLPMVLLICAAIYAPAPSSWEQRTQMVTITVNSDSTAVATISDSLDNARDEWKVDISDSADVVRAEALAAIYDSTAAAIADSLTDERTRYLAAISDSADVVRAEALAAISDSTAAAIADSLTDERTRYLAAISDSADVVRAEALAAIADSIHTITGLTVADTLKTGLIKLTATVGADSSGYGEVIIVTAGEAVTKGALLHLDIDGKCYLADADSSGTMPGMYLAMGNAGAGEALVALEQGRYRLDAWNWTPGTPLYASGTPGALTATAPSDAGDQIQAVGFAETADVIRFRPDMYTTEVTAP